MALKGRYIEADRDYVRYCLRYAVLVLGKKKVLAYIDTLDDEGNEVT
jgi:hypothetical protein